MTVDGDAQSWGADDEALRVFCTDCGELWRDRDIKIDFGLPPRP